MAAMDDYKKTEAALYAVGPQAVEVLKRAVSGDGMLGAMEIEAARDILDRMKLRATAPGS